MEFGRAQSSWCLWFCSLFSTFLYVVSRNLIVSKILQLRLSTFWQQFSWSLVFRSCQVEYIVTVRHSLRILKVSVDPFQLEESHTMRSSQGRWGTEAFPFRKMLCHSCMLSGHSKKRWWWLSSAWLHRRQLPVAWGPQNRSCVLNFCFHASHKINDARGMFPWNQTRLLQQVGGRDLRIAFHTDLVEKTLEEVRAQMTVSSLSMCGVKSCGMDSFNVSNSLELARGHLHPPLWIIVVAIKKQRW